MEPRGDAVLFCEQRMKEREGGGGRGGRKERIGESKKINYGLTCISIRLV